MREEWVKMCIMRHTSDTGLISGKSVLFQTWMGAWGCLRIQTSEKELMTNEYRMSNGTRSNSIPLDMNHHVGMYSS